MVKSDGKVTLSTKLDTSGIEKGAKNIKGAVLSTKSVVMSLAKTIATTLSVRAIVNYSKAAGDAATKNEANIQRLVDIYGSASTEVGKFIDANARALGLSKSAAADFSAVYGNLFSVWADQNLNAQLTAKYLNMTAVVASKSGRTVEDVQERVRSGLLGNTEAIEDLGIFVNVKTIEMTEAFQKMANGRSWEQLDAYEQQQVRTLAILEQATSKYGTEVADTTALTKARYKAAYEDFKATWGQVVNVVLVPVLKLLTEIFDVAIKGVQALFGFSSSTTDAVSQYSENIEQSAKNQADLTKEVKNTNKALEKTTASFDTLNILSENSSAESTAGGGVLSADLAIAGTDVIPQKTEADISSSVSGILKVLEPLQDVDFGPVKKSTSNLADSLKKLGSTGIDALDWLWRVILVPLGEWTIQTAVPEFFDMLAAAMEALDAILKAIKPSLEWLWVNMLKPMAVFVGDLFIDFLNLLTEAFTKLSDWAKENPEEVQFIFDAILGFLAGIWVYNSSKKVIDFIHNLKSAFEKLGPSLSNLGDIMGKTGLKSAFFAASVGILAAGVFTLIKNWENLEPLEQAAAILTGLAGAAIGAAIAIAAFQVSWTVGLAGAAIGGGLALLGINFALTDSGSVSDSSKAAADDFYNSFDWNKEFELPKLAKGAVIPPNREFMAILGDQTSGTNIEAPLDTIKQALAEVLAEQGGGDESIITINFTGNLAQLARVLIPEIEREDRRRGKSLAKGGRT